MSSRMRWISAIIVAGIVLGIVGYFGIGYVIYLQLSPAHAKCSAKFIQPNVVDNTPDNFRGQYAIRYEIDVSALQMPSNYEEVEFSARGEDVTLRAWFVPSETESEDVVILVHGVDTCRRYATVLIAGGMLHQAGFNILLVDLRNHGDSQITDGRAAAGTREYRDVLGAYDWVIEQGFTSENIGVWGASMGAASSINALAEESGISALWIDSSFADMRDVLISEMKRQSLPTFFAGAGFTVTNLMGLDLLAISPLDTIRQNNNRPIFITHGTADNRINVDSAYQLRDNAGENAELWIVDGTDHIEAMFVVTDEYREKLVDFFDEALRSDESP